ncbi:unnamed protein product [Leptosia nina]|uniref:Uncharacterized protein n=1 Tax=Leptosia nina TaxID=320188 RepID=A0AAV1JJ12_9NEOP
MSVAEERQTREAGGFWLGGRYGRSLHTVMSTRNDRFFFGSRYGKRNSADAPLNALDRWKRRVVCECVPREHIKRSTVRSTV